MKEYYIELVETTKSYASTNIEANSLEEAKSLALDLDPDTLDWHEEPSDAHEVFMIEEEAS